MTPVWRNRLIGLVIAAAVYALDRWIKALVVGPWRLREVEVIELLPFFDLRWTRNFGVSLGMFEATSIEMRWALVAVTGLIAVVVLIWLLRERLMADIAGLALHGELVGTLTAEHAAAAAARSEQGGAEGGQSDLGCDLEGVTHGWNSPRVGPPRSRPAGWAVSRA